MRNHALSGIRDFKTEHRRWCSEERPLLSLSAYIVRRLIYHSDLMREPCDLAELHLIARHRAGSRRNGPRPNGPGAVWSDP
jgi:hypothetical protein